MQNRNKWLSLFLTIIGLSYFLSKTVIALGQEAALSTPSSTSQDTPVQSSNVDEKALKRMQFLESIRSQLSSATKDYRAINKNVADAEQKLDKSRADISSLNAQLTNLDEQIKNTQDMIQNVQKQIIEKENKLLDLYDDMEIKKNAIEEQKRMLSEYLKTIYIQQNNVINSTEKDDSINVAKILLSDIPVGEQLRSLDYYSVMEKTGNDIMNKLELLLDELKGDQKKQEDEKVELTKLNELLTNSRNDLSIQFAAKNNLLEQTKGEEKIYRQLLEASKQQQEAMQSDLKTLRDNLSFIENKMRLKGDSFNPDDYKGILSKDTTNVYSFIEKTKNDGFNPIWPVSASRGISAYFHDESYRKAFGFIHNAIDIRASQSTPIRAPDDGVVYKVKDNGMGYSYIILAHKGGFMTVYGHVSEFRVQVGEKVMQGQTIGLSGGMPGSKGAGLMTTGPHLHFEVMKGGKYVDPLDYMPLELLPAAYIPNKYKDKLTGELIKVRRNDGLTISNDEDLTKAVEQTGYIDKVISDSKR